MRIFALLVASACFAQDQALLQVKRIFVERLSGGAQADQVRDMIIASLHRSGVFAITEDESRSDAVLRGSADDMVFIDSFQTSDGITARAGVNLGSTGSGTTRRAAGSTTASIGDRESARIQERKHEAAASVRLINRDGDVLWSTTQESLGGKFRGSSADVAERITKQLLADIDKLKHPPAADSKPANSNPLAR